MSDFSITCSDFDEGAEIPKKFGYKFENEPPKINYENTPDDAKCLALIMDDPDAMGAVGKVWVHHLSYININRSEEDWGITPENKIEGKTDFGEIGYGGPAPPDKRHTYIFKVYALDDVPDVKHGFSKKELEEAINGHIIAEAKLTGTYAP